MSVDDLTIVRRSISSRAWSTLTTSLMVAVAVALLLTLLGMRESSNDAFSRGTGNAHLLVTRDDSSLTSVLNSVFYAGIPRRAIPYAQYIELTNQGELGATADWIVPTVLGDTYKGAPVVSTQRSFFTDFEPNNGEPWQFAQGRVFRNGTFELVVGSQAAERLDLTIGKRIYLTHGAPPPGIAYVGAPQTGTFDARFGRVRGATDAAIPDAVDSSIHTEYVFEVVGILAPTGSAHDRAVFNTLIATWTVHWHDFRKLEPGFDGGITTPDQVDLGRMGVTGLLARIATRPGRDASASIQQVAAALQREGWTVASPASEVDKLFRIVSNIDVVFLGMAAVVLVSSAVSISLALAGAIGQRRRQLAVLRVLGCSRVRLLTLVVLESGVIGVLGAAMGVLFTLGGMQLVSDALYARVGVVIEPALDARSTVLVAAGAVLLAMIAGFVPGVMAYRTAVAKSLRPAA